MEAQFERSGFYKVEKDYLRFLHSKDAQVFYMNTERYERKPHFGIIVGINDMNYCIPLTSAKPRHLEWANISRQNVLIYEITDRSSLRRTDIYKQVGTNSYKKIMAVLEIRKMIPVNDDLCTYIDFSQEQDPDYRALLEKEYRFLSPLKDMIVQRAFELYWEQKQTGIIRPCYCNFNTLEAAYHEYISR